MQRGAHFFQTKTFPCSVVLKVLGISSAAARSRIGFSNIWGFVVFIVLYLWRSGALFSNALAPSVPFLELLVFRLDALVF